MPIKTYREGTELISARIPADIMRQTRILLLDPSTGIIGYGRLSNLITGLLTDWLEKRKKGIDSVLVDNPPEDKFEQFDNEGE